MDEQRLERIEDMLTNLITMVGNLNKQQQLMQEDLQSVKEELGIVKEDLHSVKEELGNIKEDLHSVKKELGSVKEDLHSVKGELGSVKENLQLVKENQFLMRSENEKHFSELFKKLTDFQSDQDYIWGKVSRNERDIAKLKSHLQL